jgi:drug/metabolite transporter (DMT)-like permease
MIGEIIALIASSIWAVSSVIYNQVINQIKLSPIQVSFYRGLIALPCLFISLFITQDSWPILTFEQWNYLIISAILGITIGDTAFFFSLQDVGVRKAILLQTMTPLFGALFAWIFLQETISNYGIIGIFLTLIGVATVILERTIDQKANNLIGGIIWGMISCATQGFAVMLLKLVLNQTNLSALWSSSIRLLVGTIAIGIWLAFKPQIKWIASDLKYHHWLKLTIASFWGTFVGLWLHQASFKLTSVGIASTLLNTTPIFALFLGLYLGEKVTWRAFLGVLIAILGIGFIFLK